jgi:sugar phosphate isomerase/epimerase
MTVTVDRRTFLAAASLLASAPARGARAQAQAPPPSPAAPATRRIRSSCNLYSFNAPLTRGEMRLEEVLEFCAEVGFDAVDPTGYYFTGYPQPPSHAEIHRIKQWAFRLGLDISGTGVRNDFSTPDADKRQADVAHVSRWVDVAARLGAPVLRVFAGLAVPAGHTRTETIGWIVDALHASLAAAERQGVVIVLQNHDDVLKTAEETLEIRRRVASPWFGLNVDIGSLRTGDPYEEVAKLAPYASTWQVKELVYRKGVAEKTDIRAIVRIMRDAGYSGYAPLETLGPGDPREKVRRLFAEFQEAIG